MAVDQNRSRGDFCANEHYTYPFPDPALMELHSPDDFATVSAEIETLLQRAKDEAFPAKHWKEQFDLIWGPANEFFTHVSDKPDKLDPLHIDLMPESRSVRVK